MKLELTNQEIEAKVKAMPLNGELLSIFRMVKLYSLVKNRAGAKPEIALNRIYRLTQNKKFDYTFAQYITRNTKIIVEVA